MVVDVVGRLAAAMEIPPGNTSDIAVAGDKGYDSRELRDTLRDQDCEPCIRARKNVKNPEPYDAALYRTRHVVENVFKRLKIYKRVASRFEKTKRMFFAFVCVVMAAIYTENELW